MQFELIMAPRTDVERGRRFGRGWRAVGITFAVVFLAGLPVHAQNSRSAQATLRISVNVVPAVLNHEPAATPRQERGLVIYDLRTQTPPIEQASERTVVRSTVVRADEKAKQSTGVNIGPKQDSESILETTVVVPR